MERPVSPVRTVRLAVAALSLALALFPSAARAQTGAAPRNQLTLDASILAAGLSYARRISSDKLVGAGAGLGTEFSVRMVRGEKWGRRPRN